MYVIYIILNKTLFGFAFEAFPHYYPTLSSLLILALFTQYYVTQDGAGLTRRASLVTLIPVDCSTLYKDHQLPIQSSLMDLWAVWFGLVFHSSCVFPFMCEETLQVYDGSGIAGLSGMYGCSNCFQSDSVNLDSHWPCMRGPLSPQPPQHSRFQTA